jgi:hypothetical protein
MKLTFRSLLVILIGAAVSFALYVGTDQWLEPSAGVTMNSNFSPVFSAWQALGGTVERRDWRRRWHIGREGGVVRRAAITTGFGEGIDLSGCGAVRSDSSWMAFPRFSAWHRACLVAHRRRKPRKRQA